MANPRLLALGAAAALLVPSPRIRAQTSDLMAACDAPEGALTVHTARLGLPTDARAIWIDAGTIRWPGGVRGGRYALYVSDSAQLTVRVGERVQGADRVIRLQLSTDSLPRAVRERFQHVGAGVTLRTTAGNTALAASLRQQMILVHEDSTGRVISATYTQMAGALDARYAAAESVADLGVRLSATGTAFRLWAPTAQRVSLCLYPSQTAPTSRVVPMRRDARTGTWSSRAAGSLAGHYYRYVVTVVVPAVGVVMNRVTDPYSVGLSANSERSAVLDLSSAPVTPMGWRTHATPSRVRAPTDLTIYELHVRDFSIGDSTVPAAHRGRYLAFTDSASNGMRHLQALADAGVTDVHLLPVFDIATIPEVGCITPVVRGAPDSEAQQGIVSAVAARDCFNWGYDPLHYTVPEGSYASDAMDATVRVREFRDMVQALHATGLRVGMDVVYNHTSAAGQAATSVLDRIVPGYYQRLDANGAVETSTCCSNTATEHRMMAKLMVESVVAWATHYRIDSFRFDLMGHQPRAVMERLQVAVNRAAGRHIHLIGEGWNFGEVADGRRFVQASQLSLNGSGIATFSDRARDAVRGGGAGDNGADQVTRQGFINGLGYAPNAMAPATGDAALRDAADMVRVGLAGSLRSFRMETADGSTQPLERLSYGGGQPAGFVTQPSEVVNYVENHDNQTLFDLNVFKLPTTTTRADRARVSVLGAAVVAFSQGIAYFHAGQELLRSKSMDRNSYDSGDWFNPLDFTYTDNGFARGLPPRRDNEASWPFMRPLLADPAIAPAATDIRFARDAFLDLLRIRASTPLFRLRTAAEVERRLRFHNTGPSQVASVIVGELDGTGMPSAGFTSVLYAINVDTVERRVDLPELAGRRYRLHPVHRAPGAADAQAAGATWEADAGRLTVPARTAVAWVIDAR